MKEVILYIPDDEYYDATLETCAAVINQQVDTWRKEHPGARRHALTTGGRSIPAHAATP